jgi:polyisoprenoid-binding protein YceI
MLRRFLGLLVLVLVARMPPAARATEFVLVPDGASQIVFTSKAPMESFSGKTRRVSGNIELDPLQLGDSIVVRVEIETASLDTGIELRNRHMRDNHLHCDRFPEAVFRGGRLTGLSATRLADGETVTGTIAGSLELHGVTKPLQAPIELTLRGGSLHVTTRFKVKLPDFDIPRPQFLVMKLDEVQNVVAELAARPKE